jgi:two-component system OmpR family sensor kinase
MSPSIRLRLLWWLSPILLLAGIAFAVPTYFNVREEVDELFDKVLREMAYSLQNSVPDAVRPQRRLAPALRDLDLISQMWSSDGQLRYRSHSFPPLPYDPDEGWATVDWRGEPWRVFTLKTPDGLIQVAQSRSERRQTADEEALHLLAPLLVLLPLLAGLVWFSLGRGLQPLQVIAKAVGRRTPDSLDPIPDEGLPREVHTLVTALNRLLQRLEEALAAQRQFTADAAHELRTPLTALSLQAQVAERAVGPEKKAESLRTLRQGIARTSHLVDQLLTLARLDPDAARQPLVPLRLDELARTVVGDFVPLAAKKRIDLGITALEPAFVPGDGEALRILLGNLLDNAIRHTPVGGKVDVNVLADGDTVRLEVNDDGPGIPPKERGRVFDRFYRGLGNPEPGSGLGLAIVRRIADRHGAAIRLADGEAGRGLKVSVRFPAHRS